IIESPFLGAFLGPDDHLLKAWRKPVGLVRRPAARDAGAYIAESIGKDVDIIPKVPTKDVWAAELVERLDSAIDFGDKITIRRGHRGALSFSPPVNLLGRSISAQPNGRPFRRACLGPCHARLSSEQVPNVRHRPRRPQCGRAR